MFIREDFRRDGLAAMHLTDKNLMSIIDSAFSDSKINIGYPLICSKEYDYCQEMLATNHQNEYCVVGHARKEHLDALITSLNDSTNSSANIWFPVSNEFLNNSISLEHTSALNYLKSSINYFKDKSNHPLDVALVDCGGNKYALDRTIIWVKELFKDTSIRNIIICDTLGNMTPQSTTYLFDNLQEYISNIEFHAHNDTNQALNNIAIAKEKNVAGVGTSLFHASERMNMIDPRELSFIDIDNNKIQEFENNYFNERGSIQNILTQIYGPRKIITGSQLRLRGRNNSFELIFGITSDTYIAEQLLNKPVDGAELANLKNKLFEKRKIYFNKEELIAIEAMKND